MSEQHEFAIRIRYADPNREGGWGPWLDGSGYNHKKKGVYTAFNHVKSAMKQMNTPYFARHNRDFQIKIVRRTVVRSEWEEIEYDGQS